MHFNARLDVNWWRTDGGPDEWTDVAPCYKQVRQKYSTNIILLWLQGLIFEIYLYLRDRADNLYEVKRYMLYKY